MSIAFFEESAVGLTWIVDEPAARTSHALIDGGRVWLIDPTDEPVTLERVAALGKPAAVLQLIDRHNRDCAALADRLGVPHLKVPAALPGTPFEVIPLVGARFWQEIALWWAEPRALVVAEAIGRRRALARAAWRCTYRAALWPPPRLGAFEPEHLWSATDLPCTDRGRPGPPRGT